mmetsp:Transcript_43486/g.80934  ORF Transcript_43486/g.80934 Transcript_43486/m.80934 type:complete len:417 (-) Transcript_43486:925-2175(-)
MFSQLSTPQLFPFPSLLPPPISSSQRIEHIHTCFTSHSLLLQLRQRLLVLRPFLLQLLPRGFGHLLPVGRLGRQPSIVVLRVLPLVLFRQFEQVLGGDLHPFGLGGRRVSLGIFAAGDLGQLGLRLFVDLDLLLEGDGAVEHELSRVSCGVVGGIDVDHEIAQPLELEGGVGRPPVHVLLVDVLLDGRIDHRVGVHDLALGVEFLLPPIRRLLDGKEVIVHPNLAGYPVGGDPRDEGLGLLPPLRLVDGALQLDHLPVLVLDDVIAGEVAAVVLESDGLVRRQSVVRLGVLESKVGGVDVDRRGQSHCVTAERFVRGRVVHLEGHPTLPLLTGLLVEIGNGHLDGIQRRHRPPTGRTELESRRLRQFLHLHQVLRPRRADVVAERVENVGGVAPLPQPRNRRHPRIVPPPYVVVCY